MEAVIKALTTALEELKAPPQGEPWLSPEQAAQYAGVSRRTLDEWISQGMPAAKRGRVVRLKATEIDTWLRQPEPTQVTAAPVKTRADEILGALKKRSQ